MTQIRFETGAIRQGASELSSAGSDLQSQFQSLVSNAPTWGADDISGLCQMVYDAIVEILQESAGGISEGWAEHSQNLEAAAQAYDSTESDNADASQVISAESQAV